MTKNTIDDNKIDVEKAIDGIYKCSKENYKNGIAIPIKNGHPCGWEWISFKNINENDIDYNINNYRFLSYDISNGFGSGQYNGLTLKEILFKVNGDFAFEIDKNLINWN